MPDRCVKGLLGRAFHSCPGIEANVAIHTVRQAFGRAAVSYEVVLSDDRGWSYLATTVAPRLSRYLRTKRMKIGTCAPVFLPIFWGDELYFVDAPTFYAYYREVEGITEATLEERARRWEEEGAVTPPVSAKTFLA